MRASVSRPLPWILAFGLLAVHATHQVTGFGGHAVDVAIDTWLYQGLQFFAAAACLIRGLRRSEERLPWLLMGAGLFSWSLGDLYWALVLDYLKNPPFPSPADVAYLGFYPAGFAAMVLLARRRSRNISSSLWLDGILGALAFSSVGAAIVFTPILHAAHGASVLAVATNLAYPIGDFVLIGVAIWSFALRGWRVDRRLACLAAGMVIGAVADAWYEYRVALGAYDGGGLINSLWPASTLLVALAAWQPSGFARRAHVGSSGAFLLPTSFILVAVGLETWDHFDRLNVVALILTTATLLTGVVRLGLAFRDKAELAARSQHEALTDALTGLGNRRRLLEDLDDTLDEGMPGSLVLFDLDGFKRYNDTYGHPAGDALLARLGRRFSEAVETDGAAYRMGGDEFCALIRGDAETVARVIDAALIAFTEHGKGFAVTSSHGAVALGKEASDPSAALQLADQRLYVRKAVTPLAAATQAHDVLMRVLYERQPDLEAHVRDVSELAVAVGHQLGLYGDVLSDLARAAELHDIGKMAVPDAILDKPARLNDEEWAFMRRHTIVGEAILRSAPALDSIAAIVRSSHERWDGDGYPDGLSGGEIPLASRIVFACDAFHAMTSDRPYQAARSVEDALDEMRRCSGTQFDPAVVDALCIVAVARMVATAQV